MIICYTVAKNPISFVIAWVGVEDVADDGELADVLMLAGWTVVWREGALML